MSHFTECRLECIAAMYRHEINALGKAKWMRFDEIRQWPFGPRKVGGNRFEKLVTADVPGVEQACRPDLQRY